MLLNRSRRRLRQPLNCCLLVLNKKKREFHVNNNSLRAFNLKSKQVLRNSSKIKLYTFYL